MNCVEIQQFMEEHFGGLDWDRDRKPFPHLKGESIMGFSLGGNTMVVGMQVLGAVMTAMTEAEAPNGPFSGHGTGEQKKDFVRKRARDLMKIQDQIDAGLMTPEQEAGVIKTFDLWVEALFSTYETAKLFQVPPPTV